MNYRMWDFFFSLYARKTILLQRILNRSVERKRAHDNCRAIKHAKCASNAIRISDYAVTSREIIARNPFSDSRKHDAKTKKKKKNRAAPILAALNFDSLIFHFRDKYPLRSIRKAYGYRYTIFGIRTYKKKK